jgi:hypothetical protein
MTQPSSSAGASPQNAPEAIKAQVAALEAQKGALNKQLVSLTIRRDLLSQQLRNASDHDGETQLRAQLADVGTRTATVNAQMNRIDDAVNNLLAGAASSSAPLQLEPSARASDRLISIEPAPYGLRIEQWLIGSVSLSALSFVLLFAVAWGALRRSMRPKPMLAHDTDARLDQLQRAIDVMSVEVERISESQRFVAKTLTNGATEEPSKTPR